MLQSNGFGPGEKSQADGRQLIAERRYLRRHESSQGARSFARISMHVVYIANRSKNMPQEQDGTFLSSYVIYNLKTGKTSPISLMLFLLHARTLATKIIFYGHCWPNIQGVSIL